MKKTVWLLCALAVFLMPAVDRADAQGRWVVCAKIDQPHDQGDYGHCIRCALVDSGHWNYVNPASPGDVCGGQGAPYAFKRAFTTRTKALKYIQDSCGCYPLP